MAGGHPASTQEDTAELLGGYERDVQHGTQIHHGRTEQTAFKKSEIARIHCGEAKGIRPLRRRARLLLPRLLPLYPECLFGCHLREAQDDTRIAENGIRPTRFRPRD